MVHGTANGIFRLDIMTTKVMLALAINGLETRVPASLGPD